MRLLLACQATVAAQIQSRIKAAAKLEVLVKLLGLSTYHV